jgi:hypothetical protein
MVLGSSASVAHHSRAYFGDEIETITGVIVDVSWRNPHVGLGIRVTGTDGTAQDWLVESNSVYNLQRYGIDRDRFEIGTAVTVVGRTSTREPQRLLMTGIVFPDGERLTLERRTAPEGYVDRVIDAAAENKGIFRVWSMPAADRAIIQGQFRTLPYTEAALAARAAWNPLDNFALRCEPEGMPRIMLNPHPFEFIDRGDAIVFRTELYDTERVIHMNVAAPPADAPTSRLGYSTGRWDDDSLVVETSRVDWPWFDNAGTPQSPDVEIIERYTLSADQSRLDFEFTVIDATTFTEPAVMRGYWLALGESILRYDCQPVER